MDARQQRTRSNLRSAILDLAAERPVGTLTVAEVARAAGITRDTFYRHTTGPVDLLVDVLRADLDDTLAAVELGGNDGSASFLDAVALLLAHVSRHATVYRGALVERTEGRLRDLLHDAVAARLDVFLQDDPGALPHVPDGLPAAETHAVLVAHCAAGTVAAITVWLRDGGHEQAVPGLARTILAAGPQWWLRESGTRT